MSGSRNNPYYIDDVLDAEPRIVDRTPRIVGRGPPEQSRVRRASSVTTRPHSVTLLRLYNPFSRTSHNRFLTTERAVHRAREEVEAESYPIREVPIRLRPSSPPPPPLLLQGRVRSLSPLGRINMSPKPYEGGNIPLPPKIETVEPAEGQARARGSARDSRQPRPSQVMDDLIHITDEQQANIVSRSPRRYRHRPQISDPRIEQELILEPSSSRSHSENFEIAQPGVTAVSSRQRNSDVRLSREYRELKEVADHNYRVAQDAAQRCATAEVRIQNLQTQLINMERRENQNNEVQDELRQELEKLRSELDAIRRASRTTRDVRDDARDRDRDNEGSGSNSGSATRHRRRRHYPVTITQDDHVGRSEAKPRTPDPRASTSTTVTTADPATDAIEQARAEARRDRVRRTEK